MALIAFTNANKPGVADDLRVNPDAVLYVEASLPDLMGTTMIHLLGEGAIVNAVNDTLGAVVSTIGGLLGATRHYLASPPAGGPNAVFISPRNISFIRPNLPSAPEFWVVRFVDGTELRILDPLPAGF